MAESEYKKALEILEAVFGKDHLEVADVLYNIGFVEQKNNKKIDASNCWKRGIQIVVDRLGTNHPKYELFQSAINELNH